MSVETDIVNAGGWIIGGSGLATMVFFVIRHFVMKVSKDATTVEADAGQRQIIGNLREELSRLEALVKTMQSTIEQHTAKIRDLEGEVTRNRANAAAALALLEVFECECNLSIREKIIVILKKMAGVEASES